jgi:hypothetical protein
MAKVHVFVTLETLSPAIRTSTDDHGLFCFAQLDAGNYGLVAQRTGYLDAVYQGSRFLGTYPQLRVRAGSHLGPVTVKMTARPILAGKVVDRDGDPIANVEVRARGPEGEEIVWRSPGNITHTDVRGSFRFYDLDPGTYRLIAVPPPGVRFSGRDRDSHGEPLSVGQVETYYPDSRSAEGAAPIVLKAGRENTSIVITMQDVKLRHISGRVPGGRAGFYLLAEIRKASGGSEVPAIAVGGDGTFRRDGLLPGRYTLRLVGYADRVVDLSAGDVDGIVMEPLIPPNDGH